MSQHHREIDIAELILAGIKVIIVCTKGFSKWHHEDSYDPENMASSLTAGGVENCHFFAWGSVSLQIWCSDSSDTSLQRYGGIGKEKSIDFAHFQDIIT